MNSFEKYCGHVYFAWLIFWSELTEECNFYAKGVVPIVK